MQTVIATLAEWAGPAVTVGVLGIVWANVQWIAKSRRVLDSVVVSLDHQREMIGVVLREQKPVRQALKAALETLRDGQCNGNVREALDLLAEADEAQQEVLISKALKEGEK